MSAERGMVMVAVPPEALAAPVEKHGLTRAEVEAAVGSPSLVEELLGIGALRPAGRRAHRGRLYDAAEVAQVWGEFKRGKYDGQLRGWRGGAA